MNLLLFAQRAAKEDFPMIMIVAGGVLVIFAFVVFVLFAKYFNLWIQGETTHATAALLELIGMTFRNVNPNIIFRAKIMAVQAGMTENDGITTPSLEAHY